MNVRSWKTPAKHCATAAPTDHAEAGIHSTNVADGDVAPLTPTTHRFSALLSVVLAGTSAVALGIARTLIENGTGYLTVGSRVLDTEESLGRLGLPGVVIPAVSALMILALPCIRPLLRPLAAVGVVAIVVGQFLAILLGGKRDAREPMTALGITSDLFTLCLVSLLVGVGALAVATIRSSNRWRTLAVSVTALFVIAAATVLGLRSSGGTRSLADPTSLTRMGLWCGVLGALSTAALGTVSGFAARRAPLAFVVCSGFLLAGSAVLLAR